MIDDEAEYEQRRQIRAQADADVAAFIESLGQDEGSGVPPPPTIKVSEVSSQPVELDFIGFGNQGSATAPGAGSSGGGQPPVNCDVFPTSVTGSITVAVSGSEGPCDPDPSCCDLSTIDGTDSTVVDGSGGYWFWTIAAAHFYQRGTIACYGDPPPEFTYDQALPITMQLVCNPEGYDPGWYVTVFFDSGGICANTRFKTGLVLYKSFGDGTGTFSLSLPLTTETLSGADFIIDSATLDLDIVIA